MNTHTAAPLHARAARGHARTVRALLALALAAPAAATAQTDPELGRIEALVAAGRTDEARTRLDQWQTGQPPDASLDGETRAHAQFLRGQLSMRWSDAEAAYVSLALSYPTSAHAPRALLRLGQGLLTAGAPGSDGAARAVGYLERLTRDYPVAPDRAAALLWLARAYRATRRPGPACSALASAAHVTADEATTELIRAEAANCANPVAPAAATPATLHAVQVGAFSTRGAAADLAARLEARGFEARVTTLDGGSLFRVRVGRFASARDAENLAQRIRAAGFDTLTVDDVQQERAAR